LDGYEKPPALLFSLMKGIILACLVLVNLVPFLSCSKSDPVTHEGKESHPPLHVRLRSDNSASERVQARNHRSWRLTRDWRISYYWHAHTMVAEPPTGIGRGELSELRFNIE
jgi:hypothetical protein